MKTIVLGAGIIGISTAWHLLERGHEVTVVDRQPDAALETSFGNAGQISVSYCEPWANRDAPLKALKWMFDKEAPLLFRPQLDWQQWRWGLQFLAQCNDAAFERNVQQIVALGAYSHAALKDVVRTTGIEYHRLERGIAHFYTDQKSFDAAGHAVELMRKHGVQRRLVSRDELLTIEPAFKAYGDKITGGTYTSTDESGDARVFTQELARRCAARGAQFLYGHDVLRLNKIGDAIDSVAVIARNTGAGGQKDFILKGDAFVVACGIERLLVGVEVGNAAFKPVVFNARAVHQFLQCGVAVGAQRHDLLHIALERRVVALGEELQAPAPLLPVHLRAKQQRCFLVEHPLERLERRLAVGPGFAIAHRNLRSIGKAGFKGSVRLAIDDDHVMTALQQVPRCADADDAGAQDNGFHGAQCA